MDNTYLLIVCHGTRSSEAARPAREFCERLRARGEWTGVELAWIQFVEPDVATALETLGARGARTIVVAPILSLPGRHLDQDIPEMVEQFRARRPDCRVIVTPALLSMEGFDAFIHSACRRACAPLRD